MLNKKIYDLNGNKIFNVSLDCDNETIFNVEKNSLVTLDLTLSTGFNSIILNLEEDSNLTLRILVLDTNAKLNIIGNVSRGTNFLCILADFSSTDSEIKSIINLNDVNASSEFHIASLSKDLENKKYSISFNHKSKETKSLIDGYGVSKNSSKILFEGVSHIYENCIKANASQKIKVILFDKESQAIGNPILKIDCDDVIANHGCAIGALKEEYLYYLESRGISEEEARNLITLGYLVPISNYFGEENKNKIIDFIGGNF